MDLKIVHFRKEISISRLVDNLGEKKKKTIRLQTGKKDFMKSFKFTPLFLLV